MSSYFQKPLFGTKGISLAMPETVKDHREWWPTCAVCNKPVERMLTCEDPSSRFVIYEAECHGAKETTRIALEDVYNKAKIKGGLAFTNPTALPVRED